VQIEQACARHSTGPTLRPPNSDLALPNCNPACQWISAHGLRQAKAAA